jgi:hypothetical protein
LAELLKKQRFKPQLLLETQWAKLFPGTVLDVTNGTQLQVVQETSSKDIPARIAIRFKNRKQNSNSFKVNWTENKEK